MKTREEWILSGKKCLAGAFEKVQSLEDPILPLRMRQRASGRGRETDTAEIAEMFIASSVAAGMKADQGAPEVVNNLQGMLSRDFEFLKRCGRWRTLAPILGR